jgi:PAS domain S-box-containing protein
MSQQPLRVLLIDDDEDDYILTRDLIGEMNGAVHSLDWVSDYDSGFKAMCANEYDVYLLDYRLGARTGIELLREAKQKGCLAPTIFLTGQGEREVDLEAMEAGATDYLEKNRLDVALLERAIRYAVTHWNYQTELERRVEERTLELETANRALRMSESRFRQALANAPMPVMLIDDREEILLLSQTWLDITGYRVEELETIEDWANLAHGEQSQQALDQLRKILRDKPDRELAEFSIHTATGTTRQWMFAASSLGELSDGRSLYICMANDVTERQHAEQALRDADRRKDEFLAVLAHELRNPLSPIRTGLEIMKRTSDPAQLEEVRDTMERQTIQMTRLIDDLLDVSRITRGRLELRSEVLELASVVRSALEATGPFIESEGHTLHVQLPDRPAYIHADPARLAQVLSNLLNNAAKYTHAGGEIWLTAQTRDGQVEITVRDTGMGIPPHNLNSIFEMFSQIDRSLESGYKGLGIGLTLVKSLVEMHRGTISVASEGPGKGSQFTVVLPIVPDPSPKPAEVIMVDHDESGIKRKILVVDDNRDAAQGLARLLELSGNEVSLAFDGEGAIESVESNRPGVVLMDIGMPKVNGYDAAIRIRSQSWGKSVVLVALTGWGQAEDRRRTKEAGFDYHLVKPVEPAELDQLLDRLDSK